MLDRLRSVRAETVWNECFRGVSFLAVAGQLAWTMASLFIGTVVVFSGMCVRGEGAFAAVFELICYGCGID